MSKSSSSPGPGRPRDPELDNRVYEAALRLYRRRGKEGVSFGSVSAESSVGKAALYRRWESADAMLLDALESRLREYTYSDTETPRDSLREDLLVFAHKSLDNYLANHTLILRVWAESESNPTLLAEHHQRVVGGSAAAARTIVARARKRGEISSDLPSAMVLAPIFGGLLGLVIMAQPSPAPEIEQALRRQAEGLVDVVLHGILALYPGPTPSAS
jgi:AcrR family transcriptional regulator